MTTGPVQPGITTNSQAGEGAPAAAKARPLTCGEGRQDAHHVDYRGVRSIHEKKKLLNLFICVFIILYRSVLFNITFYTL